METKDSKVIKQIFENFKNEMTSHKVFYAPYIDELFEVTPTQLRFIGDTKIKEPALTKNMINSMCSAMFNFLDSELHINKFQKPNGKPQVLAHRRIEIIDKQRKYIHRYGPIKNDWVSIQITNIKPYKKGK